MKSIEIKISERTYREWLYFLRRDYGTANAQLPKLIKWAVLDEVAKQAKRELEANSSS
jgi:hypothetical protein